MARAIKQEIQTANQLAIEELIKRTFGRVATTALAIARCESGLKAEAINWNDARVTGYPSQGVFQLNQPYNPKLFDYRVNIQLAYELYLKRGFSPWSCYRRI